MSSIDLAAAQAFAEDVPLIAAVAAKHGAEAGESYAQLRRWLHRGSAALELGDVAYARMCLRDAIAESSVFMALVEGR